MHVAGVFVKKNTSKVSSDARWIGRKESNMYAKADCFGSTLTSFSPRVVRPSSRSRAPQPQGERAYVVADWLSRQNRAQDGRPLAWPRFCPGLLGATRRAHASRSMMASRGRAENGGRNTTENKPGSSGIWWHCCRFVMLSASGVHLRSAVMGKNLPRSEVWTQLNCRCSPRVGFNKEAQFASHVNCFVW
jgi:hypothetical protein